MSRGSTLKLPALLADREAAGSLLAPIIAAALDPREPATVFGLARGGVVVAAVVAEKLRLPLDALCVRKVRNPWQPEYAIGAVAPGCEPYLRRHSDLSPDEVAAAVRAAQREAEELHVRVHQRYRELDPAGSTAVLVDDGLATGATMTAAVRWARSGGAGRVLAAAPVGATDTVRALAREADDVFCPYVTAAFGAVGLWYANFSQVSDTQVTGLLAASRHELMEERT